MLESVFVRHITTHAHMITFDKGPLNHRSLVTSAPAMNQGLRCAEHVAYAHKYITPSPRSLLLQCQGCDQLSGLSCEESMTRKHNELHSKGRSFWIFIRVAVTVLERRRSRIFFKEIKIVRIIIVIFKRSCVTIQYLPKPILTINHCRTQTFFLFLSCSQFARGVVMWFHFTQHCELHKNNLTLFFFAWCNSIWSNWIFILPGVLLAALTEFAGWSYSKCRNSINKQSVTS